MVRQRASLHGDKLIIILITQCKIYELHNRYVTFSFLYLLSIYLYVSEMLNLKIMCTFLDPCCNALEHVYKNFTFSMCAEH